MIGKTMQGPVRLSDLEKARLEEHAEWFGMSLKQERNRQYTLRLAEGSTAREVQLGSESAHLRLLAELCTRTAPWICYAVGDSCAEVYLGHSDFRIRRLAELYAQRAEWEDVGPLPALLR